MVYLLRTRLRRNGIPNSWKGEGHMDFWASEKRWAKNNLFHPSILAAWALIALAASSSWMGLIFLFLAIPVIKKVIYTERGQAYYDGYDYGRRSVVVSKKSKDMTEKENEESYW